MITGTEIEERLDREDEYFSIFRVELRKYRQSLLECKGQALLRFLDRLYDPDAHLGAVRE